MMPTQRSPLLGCMALALMMGSADAKKPPAARGPAAAVPAPAPAAKPLPQPPDSPSNPDAASTAPQSPAEAAAPPAAATATAAPPTPPTPPAPPTPPIPHLTPDELAVARQHFEAGTQAFEDNRYEVALNEFTTSFEISKEPDLLYNLHRVAIRLGQKDMAVNYLRQYLEYRPADAVKIQTEIDQINAQPLPPPAPPAPPTPRVGATAADTGPAAPRWPGVVLMVFGGASAATGAALLAATGALATDTATDKVRGNSLLGAGGFLLGTGVVEVIGGAVLYLKRRPRAQVALVPSGAGLQLVGLY